jgi:hypothetical protein
MSETLARSSGGKHSIKVFAKSALGNEKDTIEQMERAVTEENKKLALLEAKAVAWLDELGRESYKHPRGSIGVNEKWRFNLPQGDENKAKFFNYLRERGLYDKYATVNANSYNSFLLAEWEVAKEEGRGMEFSVPGVPEPKFFRALSTRKGK